eukprot:GHVQ01011331.1.p1 GENE.GHVQ01011331.1~~GHVQ01011331.1.p1  ORF type:complete len:1525 (-),score=186.44 GHVQ01011331.1:3406-7980(-)
MSEPPNNSEADSHANRRRSRQDDTWSKCTEESGLNRVVLNTLHRAVSLVAHSPCSCTQFVEFWDQECLRYSYQQFVESHGENIGEEFGLWDEWQTGDCDSVGNVHGLEHLSGFVDNDRFMSLAGLVEILRLQETERSHTQAVSIASVGGPWIYSSKLFPLAPVTDEPLSLHYVGVMRGSNLPVGCTELLIHMLEQMLKLDLGEGLSRSPGIAVSLGMRLGHKTDERGNESDRTRRKTESQHKVCLSFKVSRKGSRRCRQYISPAAMRGSRSALLRDIKNCLQCGRQPAFHLCAVLPSFSKENHMSWHVVPIVVRLHLLLRNQAKVSNVFADIRKSELSGSDAYETFSYPIWQQLLEGVFLDKVGFETLSRIKVRQAPCLTKDTFVAEGRPDLKDQSWGIQQRLFVSNWLRTDAKNDIVGLDKNEVMATDELFNRFPMKFGYEAFMARRTHIGSAFRRCDFVESLWHLWMVRQYFNNDVRRGIAADVGFIFNDGMVLSLHHARRQVQMLIDLISTEEAQREELQSWHNRSELAISKDALADQRTRVEKLRSLISHLKQACVSNLLQLVSQAIYDERVYCLRTVLLAYAEACSLQGGEGGELYSDKLGYVDRLLLLCQLLQTIETAAALQSMRACSRKTMEILADCVGHSVDSLHKVLYLDLAVSAHYMDRPRPVTCGRPDGLLDKKPQERYFVRVNKHLVSHGVWDVLVDALKTVAICRPLPPVNEVLPAVTRAMTVKLFDQHIQYQVDERQSSANTEPRDTLDEIKLTCNTKKRLSRVQIRPTKTQQQETAAMAPSPVGDGDTVQRRSKKNVLTLFTYEISEVLQGTRLRWLCNWLVKPFAGLQPKPLRYTHNVRAHVSLSGSSVTWAAKRESNRFHNPCPHQSTSSGLHQTQCTANRCHEPTTQSAHSQRRSHDRRWDGDRLLGTYGTERESLCNTTLELTVVYEDVQKPAHLLELLLDEETVADSKTRKFTTSSDDTEEFCNFVIQVAHHMTHKLGWILTKAHYRTAVSSSPPKDLLRVRGCPLGALLRVDDLPNSMLNSKPTTPPPHVRREDVPCGGGESRKTFNNEVEHAPVLGGAVLESYAPFEVEDQGREMYVRVFVQCLWSRQVETTTDGRSTDCQGGDTQLRCESAVASSSVREAKGPGAGRGCLGRDCSMCCWNRKGLQFHLFQEARHPFLVAQQNRHVRPWTAGEKAASKSVFPRLPGSGSNCVLRSINECSAGSSLLGNELPPMFGPQAEMCVLSPPSVVHAQRHPQTSQQPERPYVATSNLMHQSCDESLFLLLENSPNSQFLEDAVVQHTLTHYLRAPVQPLPPNATVNTSLQDTHSGVLRQQHPPTSVNNETTGRCNAEHQPRGGFLRAPSATAEVALSEASQSTQQTLSSDGRWLLWCWALAGLRPDFLCLLQATGAVARALLVSPATAFVSVKKPVLAHMVQEIVMRIQRLLRKPIAVQCTSPFYVLLSQLLEKFQETLKESLQQVNHRLLEVIDELTVVTFCIDTVVAGAALKAYSAQHRRDSIGLK